MSTEVRFGWLVVAVVVVAAAAAAAAVVVMAVAVSLLSRDDSLLMGSWTDQRFMFIEKV